MQHKSVIISSLLICETLHSLVMCLSRARFDMIPRAYIHTHTKTTKNAINWTSLRNQKKKKYKKKRNETNHILTKLGDIIIIMFQFEASAKNIIIIILTQKKIRVRTDLFGHHHHHHAALWINITTKMCSQNFYVSIIKNT